jgi:hypothetical protein
MIIPFEMTLSSLLQDISAHKDALIPLGALLSGCAALIGSIVAGIAIVVSLTTSRRTLTATINSTNKQLQSNREIAERNVRADVISANRQDWINALRTEIAHALKDLRLIRTQFAHLDNAQRREILSDFTFRQNMIHLLINPRESDHQRLCKTLSSALHSLATAKPDPDETAKKFDAFGDEIVAISQEILKREWERVKKLD